MRRCLLAIVALSILASPALADTSGNAGLRAYMRKVTRVIHTYRSVAKRGGKLLSQQPADDVGLLVDGLTRISSDFEGLNSRWNALKAPPGLGLKHRGVGGAFRLQAEAFALLAEAWEEFGTTQDGSALAAGTQHAGGLFHSAAYLQKRWAIALTGALIRAGIPAPAWLTGMATQT
jgi:hypothetical protein